MAREQGAGRRGALVLGKKKNTIKQRECLPFSRVANITVKDGAAKVNMAQGFLRYLMGLPKDQQDAVTNQLIEQQLNGLAVVTNEDDPFHDDPEGFEQYCRVKYKLLYDHVVAFLEMNP